MLKSKPPLFKPSCYSPSPNSTPISREDYPPSPNSRKKIVKESPSPNTPFIQTPDEYILRLGLGKKTSEEQQAQSKKRDFSKEFKSEQSLDQFLKGYTEHYDNFYAQLLRELPEKDQKTIEDVKLACLQKATSLDSTNPNIVENHAFVNETVSKETSEKIFDMLIQNKFLNHDGSFTPDTSNLISECILNHNCQSIKDKLINMEIDQADHISDILTTTMLKNILFNISEHVQQIPYGISYRPLDNITQMASGNCFQKNLLFALTVASLNTPDVEVTIVKEKVTPNYIGPLVDMLIPPTIKVSNIPHPFTVDLLCRYGVLRQAGDIQSSDFSYFPDDIQESIKNLEINEQGDLDVSSLNYAFTKFDIEYIKSVKESAGDTQRLRRCINIDLDEVSQKIASDLNLCKDAVQHDLKSLLCTSTHISVLFTIKRKPFWGDFSDDLKLSAADKTHKTARPILYWKTDPTGDYIIPFPPNALLHGEHAHVSRLEIDPKDRHLSDIMNPDDIKRSLNRPPDPVTAFLHFIMACNLYLINQCNTKDNFESRVCIYTLTIGIIDHIDGKKNQQTDVLRRDLKQKITNLSDDNKQDLAILLRKALSEQTRRRPETKKYRDNIRTITRRELGNLSDSQRNNLAQFFSDTNNFPHSKL